MKDSYGFWQSPITAARVAAGSLRFDHIQLDSADVYWLEGRPAEGGRYLVVQATLNGPVDFTPPGFNVRSRVHEYGGSSYTVHNGVVYFSNFDDQRVYRQVRGEAPVPITEPGPYWADYRVDAARQRLIGIREENNINVVAEISGATGAAASGVRVLVEGADFYAHPVVSANGRFLAWLQWNHPNMPWDGTELWVGAFDANGLISAPEKVAGGVDESIFQPEWLPDGSLCFVSDRTGWWNLYRCRLGASGVAGTSEAMCPMAAEFGKPQWTLSMKTYAVVDATRIAATYTEEGRWKLAFIDFESKTFTPVAMGIQPLESINSEGADPTLYFVGGSATDAPAIYRWTDRQLTVLRSSTSEPLDREWISIPEAITFTVHDRDVHAFYYPPHNPNVVPPAGERPPLLVITHGGPTGATTDVLELKIQFWTSRGFAVLDVDYSGSTGYGRPYRDRLKGQWGIVDVEDAVGGAQAMVRMGKADPTRLIIRGGSAGGYTTLAALTFHQTFTTGASYYGISDLEVLQHDTHKFEARYNDTLIGPYPEAREVYIARSPIHFTDRLSCPIILFQGLEDKVVPPNQSEMMAEAARRKGLKVKYVTFAGEQHGFRKAETIIRALEEELAFYQEVFAGLTV